MLKQNPLGKVFPCTVRPHTLPVCLVTFRAARLWRFRRVPLCSAVLYKTSCGHLEDCLAIIMTPYGVSLPPPPKKKNKKKTTKKKQQQTKQQQSKNKNKRINKKKQAKKQANKNNKQEQKEQQKQQQQINTQTTSNNQQQQQPCHGKVLSYRTS